MNTGRQTGKFLAGWLVVALMCLGQAPLRGDPNCPNCGRAPAGPIMPTPLGLSPQGESPLGAMPAGVAQGNETAPPSHPSAGFPGSGLPHADLPAGQVFPGPFLNGPALTQGQGPVTAPLGLTSLPGGLHTPPPLLSAPGPLDPAEVDIPIPLIKLRILAPACGAVGKEVEYRIKVVNCSPADAHNVVVRTSLPASVRVLRASPQVHQKDPELQWNLGTVPAFGCHDLILVMTPVGLADIKSCTRVQYEHGQCVTTRIAAFPPTDGGAGGAGSIGGPSTPGGPGGSGGPGGKGPEFGGPLDVRVFGPADATAGQDTRYKVTVFNKGDRPLYKVGVLLEWSKEFEYRDASEKLTGPPGLMAWPEGLIDQLNPNTSRTLELVLRTRFEGRLCVKASASASVSKVIEDNRVIESKDEACTVFRRGIPGMTLEMFDRDDPILINGQTTYPITVRNQSATPITNLRIKMRVPDMLEVDQVRGPVRYKSGLDPRQEMWVEFEPLPSLGAGETQSYELAVRARSKSGDARFHLEMTADQLDRGPNGVERWIIEEESTTIVPDEETRVRVRELSRQRKAIRALETSIKPLTKTK